MTLIGVDRAVARDVFGERRGRTISTMVGDGADRALRLPHGVGKDLFHLLLLVVGVIAGVALLAKLR